MAVKTAVWMVVICMGVYPHVGFKATEGVPGSPELRSMQIAGIV